MNTNLSWKEVKEASYKHKEIAMRITDYFSRPLSFLLVRYTKVTPKVSLVSFLFILLTV